MRLARYLLVLLFSSFFSCGNAENNVAVQTITPQQLQQISTENQNAIIIDVRTPGEFTGNLGQTMSLP